MPDRAQPSADPAQAERLHTFAHDIKNRLGGLWEVLRLIGNGPLEGVSKDELLDYAERAYFKAQRDIESLLDDFQVVRGISITDARAVDVAACLNAAIANEAHRFEKKAQMVTTLGETSAIVQGDDHWITQVMQALLSNASKFSPRGSVIKADIIKDPGRIIVNITDQGVGLTPEDIDQLFTRYAVLSSRGTDGEPQARGTLARARQWAQALGGGLTAHSDGPGKGCTLRLELPATD